MKTIQNNNSDNLVKSISLKITYEKELDEIFNDMNSFVKEDNKKKKDFHIGDHILDNDSGKVYEIVKKLDKRFGYDLIAISEEHLQYFIDLNQGDYELF